MGTLSPRGRHSEVASTTSDDEVKADWPAGGQRPGIPQENEEAENEEAENEEAANEEEGAAIENGGARRKAAATVGEESHTIRKTTPRTEGGPLSRNL
ncbi:hypothetical protein NDU88_010169 [Pleurodeles waltl]|uniref:Uncharacterized protein n=1 Tax=Pleurodeles waltl TaxID=8319 RepID=A0AAV7QWQ4_PLEWA|nr:hypothetical protein NDU88_010169 [Pleurodeles waltl]